MCELYTLLDRPIRYVEKKTCEFAVQAARIADFPSTIGASLAEMGFTLESLRGFEEQFLNLALLMRLGQAGMRHGSILAQRWAEKKPLIPTHHLRGSVWGNLETVDDALGFCGFGDVTAVEILPLRSRPAAKT